MNISEQLSLLQNIKGNFKTRLVDIGANLDDDTPFSAYPEFIQKIEKTVYTDKVNGSTNRQDSYSKIVFDKCLGSNFKREAAPRIISDKLNITKLNLNVLQTGGSISPSGVFTGGAGAYLAIKDNIPFSTADSWEFRTKYTYTNKSTGSREAILGHNGSIGEEQGLLLCRETNIDELWALVPNQAQNDWLTASMRMPVIDGTAYYIKWGFTGSSYYFEYNIEGWDKPFTSFYIIN